MSTLWGKNPRAQQAAGRTAFFYLMPVDRAALLASLAREREERRALAAASGPISVGAAASDASADERRTAREALMQKLLSERGARSVGAEGAASSRPAEPRTAWKEQNYARENQLEAEHAQPAHVADQTSSSSFALPEEAEAAGGDGGEPSIAAHDAVAREREALEADALALGAMGAAELVELAALDGVAQVASLAPAAAVELLDLRLEARHTVEAGAARRETWQPSRKMAAAAPPKPKPAAAATASPREQRAKPSVPAAAGSGCRSCGGGGGGAAAAKDKSAVPLAFGSRPQLTPRRKSSGSDGGKQPGADPAAECSFQPQINERSSKLAEVARRESSGGTSEGWSARLATQRAAEFAKREVRRMEAERAKLAECTFTPSINPASAGRWAGRAKGGKAAHTGKGGWREDASDAAKPIGERLHSEADRRAEMRERSRIASEQWELDAHSFAPYAGDTST